MAVVMDSRWMVRDFPACSGRPLLDFRLLNQEINLYMCASGYLKRPSVTLLNILALL